ncbi:MAG: RIO1 family regulatory kinase/ATPase [Nitrosotalea sp.]
MPDELQEELAKRIEGKLVEKDRERKSQKDGFNNNKVFDFGSAVDIRHPNAIEFLERDIKNIARFFVKRGLTVENPRDILKRII